MRYKNIFWGVLFLAFGILWLLKSVSVITFSWIDMIELWPLIFIWIGIGLLPIKEWIKISLDIIILAIGVVFLLSPTNFNRFTGCDETTKVDLSVTDIFVIPMDTNRIMTASLEADMGAGEFSIVPDSNLITINGISAKYIKNKQFISGSDAEIELDIIPPFAETNRVLTYEIGLHPAPVWDLSFDMGAVSTTFDLTPFKVKEVSIDAGASDISLTIGNLYPDVHVDLSTGAANITIRIPKEMTCYVTTESALTNHSLTGFTKTNKGNYVYTPDSTSIGTIDIDLNSGVSNIDIERY